MIKKPLVAKRANANKVEAGKTHGRGQEKVPQNSVEPIDTQKELAKSAQVSHDTIAKIAAD